MTCGITPHRSRRAKSAKWSIRSQRLVARQAGLHVAQYEHRKHGARNRGADDAVAPHVVPSPAQHGPDEQQRDEEAKQHADGLRDDGRRNCSRSGHEPERQRRSSAFHAQRPRHEDHQCRDLFVVFLKFAAAEVARNRSDNTADRATPGGRPKRAGRHSRRKRCYGDGGEDDAGKIRKRGCFRVGQQHAQKGQPVAL